MPAVSILMPARNARATLDEAVASIVAQSFTDWELIAVEDGSGDGTPELLAAWARRDPRIRVLHNPEPRGLVNSLNRAAAAARAPVLARMDADDVSLPSRLERQVERLAGGDVELVGCRVRYFPEELVAGGARRYEEWLNSLTTPEEHARDVFVECPIAHPTMLLRREAFECVGGYVDRGWPEDYDLCLRLWQAGFRMAKVPELLFHWRERPDRTSRIHPAYQPDAFYRFKAHYLRATVLAERPALVMGAGPVGKALARALREAGAVVRAFAEVDPGKIGQRIMDAPVLDADSAWKLRGEVFGLAAVGRPAGRASLRAVCSAAGWVEGDDFCCVA
jgi:glycosyltransferase involved in cell wall biosynthesis